MIKIEKIYFKIKNWFTKDPWNYDISKVPEGSWVLVWIDGPGVVRAFRTNDHWFPYDPTHTVMYCWSDKDVLAWMPLIKHPCPFKVKRKP